MLTDLLPRILVLAAIYSLITIGMYIERYSHVLGVVPQFLTPNAFSFFDIALLTAIVSMCVVLLKHDVTPTSTASDHPAPPSHKTVAVTPSPAAQATVIDHRFFPHVMDVLAVRAPLELRSTSKYWRDRIESFTAHWRLERMAKAGKQGYHAKAFVYTHPSRRRPWEEGTPQPRTHVSFPQEAQFPLPRRLARAPPDGRTLAGLVRVLDVVANKLDKRHHWRTAFPNLEIVRYFACTVGDRTPYYPEPFPLVLPSLLAAPTAILFASVLDDGFKFALPSGVKQVIISIGEPVHDFECRVGVSNPNYFLPINLCHMLASNPAPLPDTTEHITFVFRNVELWGGRLRGDAAVWTKCFESRARCLARGGTITFVGNLNPVLPEKFFEIAAISQVDFPFRARELIEMGDPMSLTERVLEGLPHTIKEWEAMVNELPHPALARPIREIVRVLSAEQWRAEVGERLYALAMDATHTDI
jgi:hypothetical protein